jgi:hypothetical protein
MRAWACLVLVCLVACQDKGSQEQCNCGTAPGITTMLLTCASPGPSGTQVTGACAVSGAGQGYINVTGDEDGGTCHVEIDFEGGAAFSTDITFAATWLPCGSDPHGCGPGVIATPDRISVGSQCSGDAGLDGGQE